jgi:hypothetical protein
MRWWKRRAINYCENKIRPILDHYDSGIGIKKWALPGMGDNRLYQDICYVTSFRFDGTNIEYDFIEEYTDGT